MVKVGRKFSVIIWQYTATWHSILLSASSLISKPISLHNFRNGRAETPVSNLMRVLSTQCCGMLLLHKIFSLAQYSQLSPKTTLFHVHIFLKLFLYLVPQSCITYAVSLKLTEMKIYLFHIHASNNIP